LIASFVANIPFVIFFTVFGESVEEFDALAGSFLIIGLLLLAYLFREKNTLIKWQEFFDTSQ
jgi:hypothetical protein